MTDQLFEITPGSVPAAKAGESVPKGTSGVVGRITSRAPPAAMNLLVLSYRSRPDEWVRDWRIQAGTVPPEFGFVGIGRIARSAAASEESTARGESPPPAEAFADPTDVIGLKDSVRAYLDGWATNGRQTVLYLDSLGPLLRSVGLPTAYSFLHTLAGRIRSANAYGYYLLRSSADAPEVADLLRDLADYRTEHVDPISGRRSAYE